MNVIAEESSSGKGKDDANEDLAAKDQLSSRYPFCNEIMGASPKTSCTADRKAVGSCNLVQFSSSLPEIYQNFDAVEGIDIRDIAKVC